MKKITLCLMTAVLALTFQPIQSKAVNTPTSLSVPVSKPIGSDEARTLVLRLNEINAMDKSTLSRSEKRSLRREVRSIDKTLRENSGGVYISVGAIIIILLLLIILL